MSERRRKKKATKKDPPSEVDMAMLAGMLRKFDKLKEKDRPKSVRNPLTGKTIRTDGQTFRTLMRAGLGCDGDKCSQLRKEKKYNPFTGRALKSKSATYKLLVKGCDSCDVGKVKVAQSRRAKLERVVTAKVTSMRDKKMRAAAREKHEKELLQRIRARVTKERAAKGQKKLENLIITHVKAKRAAKADEAARGWKEMNDKRVRELERHKGLVYLESHEVEYILRYHMLDNTVPSNVCPTVINMSIPAAPQFRRHLKNGKCAVICDGEHFAAIRVFINDQGMWRIEYFEPMDHIWRGFSNSLRQTLTTLNGSRPTQDEFKAYLLGWQTYGGPCGVYAAFAVFFLSGDQDLRKSGIKRNLAPTIKEVEAEYQWMANNLVRLHIPQ
jgi:hypothetical protein